MSSCAAGYPPDFDEFLKLFTSDENCVANLERVRWGKGFYCPYRFTLNSYWRLATADGAARPADTRRL